MKEKFTLRCAVHLFLIQDGKTLLLRRYNTGWRDGEYSVIAGHIDGNESIRAAMVREAKEEGGIDIDPDDIRVVHTMHRHAGDREYIDFFLTAEQWQGEVQIMEKDKCDDLSWFPLTHLPENIIPYVRSALQEFGRGKTFSEFGW